MLAAGNRLAPTQHPLTFALVLWGAYFLVAVAALGPLAVVLARRGDRHGRSRALVPLAALVLALVALAQTPDAWIPGGRSGPARFRWLLPAASALAVIGLGALAVARGRPSRTAGVASVLAVAAGLGAMAPGPRARPPEAPPRPERSSAPRVVLVAIDGADWRAIDPLLARGELPHLAALKRAGAWGPLKTFAPAVSPEVWTTIVTGKPPAEHGVDGFTERRLAGVAGALPRLRAPAALGWPWLERLLTRVGAIVEAPISSDARRVPALWNIASREGAPLDVLAWWATWPAEPILGRMVSERAFYAPLRAELPADARGLTFPESLQSRIAEDVVLAERIADADLQSFAAFTPAELSAMRATPRAERRELQWLPEFVSLHESTRRIALSLLRDGRSARTDLLVLFRLVDMAAHTSMRHSELVAAHPGSTPPDSARFGRVVSEAYRRVDAALGDLLAAAGDANVVVASDHGFDLYEEGGRRVYGHRDAPDGILIASGPAFRAARLEGTSVYDIFPLLLYLEGFAVADDLPGRVPLAAFADDFRARAPLGRVASYGTRDATRGPAADRAVEREMREGLRALGYVD